MGKVDGEWWMPVVIAVVPECGGGVVDSRGGRCLPGVRVAAVHWAGTGTAELALKVRRAGARSSVSVVITSRWPGISSLAPRDRNYRRQCSACSGS